MTLVVHPYAASRFVPCPGSVALEARYPETEKTEDQLAGRASHWAASELLRGADVAIGQVTPGDTVLDEEMIDGATMYADDVRAVPNHYVEYPIMVPVIQGDAKPLPAVIDAWALNAYVLDIWEYKFGHGYVEEFENWQLIGYAMALRDKLRLSDDTLYTVRFHVVQPRAHHRNGHKRVWEVNLGALRALFNKYEQAVHEARGPNPRCNPGAWCRDCRGRSACEAITAATYVGMDDSGTTLPLELDARATGLELQRVDRALMLLEARKTGLEQQAMHMITRSGQRVPGFDVATSVGRARWNMPDPDVVMIGQMLGVPLAKPQQAVTPEQARKAGMSEELVKQYSFRPNGGPKLVRDDGKALRRAFGTK